VNVNAVEVAEVVEKWEAKVAADVDKKT